MKVKVIIPRTPEIIPFEDVQKALETAYLDYLDSWFDTGRDGIYDQMLNQLEESKRDTETPNFGKSSKFDKAIKKAKESIDEDEKTERIENIRTKLPTGK